MKQFMFIVCFVADKRSEAAVTTTTSSMNNMPTGVAVFFRQAEKTSWAKLAQPASAPLD